MMLSDWPEASRLLSMWEDGAEGSMKPVKRRPSVAELGLNPLAKALLTLQLVLAVGLVVSASQVGLTVMWSTSAPIFVWDAVLMGLWFYLASVPGGSREWVVAETVLGWTLILLLSHLLAPAQYVAVAANRPLIDRWLAAADGLFGVNVGDLAAWTSAHPQVGRILRTAYFSLLAQFVLIPPVLGMLLRDRDALWEYVFHFHFCAIVTVLALALFPAACAFQYYGFTSVIDQSRFIAHFNGLRDGTMHVIRFNDLEGLISMPSFHVAGAMMVQWSLRRFPLLFWPVAVLNGFLVASTFMTGAHYVIDLVGTSVMFAVSLFVWRKVARRLVEVVPAPSRFSPQAASVGLM
jgi:hypothetical protein